MGDCSWVYHRGSWYTVLVCNQRFRPTQPPTLSRTGNEYRQRAVTVLCCRKGNRSSGIALAMHHRLWPRAGSGEYRTLDPFVDFGTIYISFACLHGMLPHLSFFLRFCPYLPFPLRIDPLCFQAGGCKRQPNLGHFSCLLLAQVGCTFSLVICSGF